MKKIFFSICYVANVLYFILLFLLPIFYFFFDNTLQLFLQTNIWGDIINVLLTILTIVFWVYCIVIWAKFDRKAIRLILIIFLSCIYNTFYFVKIVRNKWGW